MKNETAHAGNHSPNARLKKLYACWGIVILCLVWVIMIGALNGRWDFLRRTKIVGILDATEDYNSYVQQSLQNGSDYLYGKFTLTFEDGAIYAVRERSPVEVRDASGNALPLNPDGSYPIDLGRTYRLYGIVRDIPELTEYLGKRGERNRLIYPPGADALFDVSVLELVE